MKQYSDDAEFMRRTRKTGLNEASSRSHLVFAVIVKARDKKTGKTTIGILAFIVRVDLHFFSPCNSGKTSLCDLAGSERADKINVEGLSQKERAAMV